MTSPNLAYTQEGMAAAQAKIQATIEAFTAELGKVNSEMAALQSAWTGHASNTFGQAMDSWEAHCRKIIDELSAIYEKMGGNSKTLQAQEEDAANIAGSWAAFDKAGGLPGLNG